MPSCKASVGSSTPTLLFLDLRTHGGIKWPRAGAILANHYSLAWRTMDAQHWGVPQRRLRISLVLDLTGGRAGEILFELESLRGHFAPGVTPGQATAGTVENSAGTADCTDRLPDNATLGSLFDGIGGFPYVWEQLHAGRKELCVWASEIEEFPIAVTKKWFPEVEDGKLF